MIDWSQRTVAAVLLLLTTLAAISWWAQGDAPGVVRWQQADMVMQPDLPDAVPPEAGWQRVALPVRRPASEWTDERVESLWWYRLRLPPAGDPQALYVPRLTGSAVRVMAREPDQPWRMLWDGRDQWAEQWNRPLWVPLGPVPQGLEVVIGLSHRLSSGHRLTQPRTGPVAPLHLRLELRRLLQLAVPQAGSLAFVMLGLMALLHWLRRPTERAYLLFALTAVAWLVRNLHYHVAMPRDDEAYLWFWWLSNVSMAWVMVLIYLFTLRFTERRHPRVEWALLGYGALATLIAAPSVMPWVSLTMLHVLNVSVGLTVTGWLLWLARRGGAELRAVTTALVITDLAGLHDLIMVSTMAQLESVYLLPVAMLAVLTAYLYAAQQRYTRALASAERANLSLAERLAAREAELRAGHERLRAVEREQTLLLERQRLMRDMHDGLGSTLMSSLVAAERGRLDSTAVAGLLRDCVDDLRLVIDSLEPIDHDLVTLLGALRYRLGRRLEGAGLHVDWAVDDVPALPWLGPPEALQVLRCVQEALTNVLKHAGARTVRIATTVRDGEVRVAISDDGQGFDPAQVTGGRGLRHLRERAAQWGGRAELHSTPGEGTAVWLMLPLVR